MEGQICNHFKYGYCKFKEACQKVHVTGECKKLSSCKDKYCNTRHPKICKRFSLEKFCKFGEDCAYLHLQDLVPQGETENEKCSQDTKSSLNEVKIELLEGEVKTLKLELKKLKAITEKLYEKVKDIKSTKLLERDQEKETIPAKENVPSKEKIPERMKFKCEKCDASFKKQVTLQKHINTKHVKTDTSKGKELGEGQFGFALRNQNNDESFKDNHSLKDNDNDKDDDHINISTVHGAVQGSGQGLFPPRRFLPLHQPPGNDLT